MSIIYSLICKSQPLSHDIIPLCEYDNATGNYPQVILEMLKQYNGPAKKTYMYNSEFNFHFFKDGGVIYVAMADVSYNQKLALQFLQDLKGKLNQRYSPEQIQNAKPHGLGGFFPIYNSIVLEYNSNKVDKKAELDQKLTSIKGVLTQNIEKLLQKQQKVALLVNRSQHLDQFASNIRMNASRIQNPSRKWLKVGGVVLVVVVVLYLVFRHPQTSS